MQLLSALRKGVTVGMLHYLAHGINLVRVVKDNVQLMLCKDYNVSKYSSLIIYIHVGQGGSKVYGVKKNIT